MNFINNTEEKITLLYAVLSFVILQIMKLKVINL